MGAELDVSVKEDRYVMGRMQRTPTTVAIRKSNRLTKEPEHFQAMVESIFIDLIIFVRRAEADAWLGFFLRFYALIFVQGEVEIYIKILIYCNERRKKPQGSINEAPFKFQIL